MARDKWGTWYVWFTRTKCRSLRTKDYDEARGLFQEVRTEWLKGNLRIIERGKRISLKDFTVAYMKTRRGISASTCRADSLALRKMEDFAGNLPDLRKIDSRLLSMWIASMRGGIKAASVNTYLRHLRAALGVAKEWGYIEGIPALRFETEAEKIPRLMDVDAELAKITDQRLLRMATVYAWTGARRSELLLAKWKDVQGNLLRLKGKRGKERLVPLLPVAKEALGSPGQPEDRIFPYWEHPDTVSHLFHKATGKRLHDLRHTTASMLVMAGADLDAVRRIMGHADLKTTERYLHTTESHLMEAMNRLQHARSKQGVVVQLLEIKE